MAGRKKQTFMSLEDRKIIEHGLVEGLKPNYIAAKLNRAFSGIYKEINKFNTLFPAESYNAEKMHKITRENIKNRGKYTNLQGSLKIKHSFILEMLNKKLPLRQMARQLNVSISTLRRYFHDNNLDIQRYALYTLSERILELETQFSSLSMQLEILTELIKELHNDRNKTNK